MRIRSTSTGLFGWIAGVALCLFFPPSYPAQTAEVVEEYIGGWTPPVPASTIRDLLRETIFETADFQEERPLKEVLSRLEKIFPEKGRKVRWVIDQEAFLKEDARAPQIETVPVRFPQFPKQVAFMTGLRLSLEQVLSAKAVLWIRSGEIVITTEARVKSRYFLYNPIDLARFSKVPLANALDELAELSGIPILLDPRVGKKARTPVTAKFSNIRLETAVLLLTDMAGLKHVVLDNVIYVTHPENAPVIKAKPVLRLGETTGDEFKFKNEPLSDILGKVIFCNGLVDPGVKKEAKTRLTAKFINPVETGTALRLLADMAGLDAVVIENLAYITTQENARRLEKRSP